jgi:hypothetical protein
MTFQTVNYVSPEKVFQTLMVNHITGCFEEGMCFVENYFSSLQLFLLSEGNLNFEGQLHHGLI